MEEQVEKKDFIRFLNRIYYINSHLTERLDELRSSPLFIHLHTDIDAAIKLLELQLDQIDHVFDVLKAVNSYNDCAPMIAFLESIFTLIQSLENNTPYFFLLDYISVADSLMAESARLAELSLSLVPELNLPDYQLHDPLTLQALKGSLYNTYIMN